MSFDLEKAIDGWRKKMSSKSFEPGDLEELEDHLRNRIDDFVLSGLEPNEAFEKAVSKDFSQSKKLEISYKASRHSEGGLGSLLLNYYKVAFRSISKHSQYSLINIIGLVVGLTSVFGIFLFINQELSFDRFHDKADETYRVNLHILRASGEINYPLIPPAVGPAISTSISGVKNITRLRYAYPIIMKQEETAFFEREVFFAESAFLEMFSLPFKLGNQQGALEGPNKVVITETIAEKYFGNENPLGKTINYNNEIDLEVTGVLNEPPTNSHFKFQFLISFETFVPGQGSLEPMTSWRWLGFLTYVQLEEGVDISDFQTQTQDLFVANNNSSTNRRVEIELQPLTSIYLGSGDLSNPMGGLFRTSDPAKLKSLAIVAVLIIVIAFFNYFNVATALMFVRSKEFGMRKVLGSSKGRILLQLFVETSVIVLISGVLSIMAIWALAYTGYLPALQLDALIKLVGLMLAICAVFGLCNGLYIGLSMVSKATTSLLKGISTQLPSKLSGRKIVLLIQYGISSGLIMISLIVVTQIRYFSNKDLGYNKDGVLVVGFRGEDAMEKRDRFRDVTRNNPMIKAISFGPSLDGSASGSPLRPLHWPEEEIIQTAYFGVDYEFPEVIGLPIVAGRYFNKNIATDSTRAILINETLAEKLDFDNPIGEKVLFAGDDEFQIIGIFSDFHHKSLHHQIGPMALTMWHGPPRNMLVKFQGDEISAQALEGLAKDWEETFSGNGFPFEYRQLTDQLDDLYAREKDFGQLIELFTALAIFVAILGLYGFSSVNTRLKIKQICMRRVLGAELKHISEVMTRNILIISLIGGVIAVPIIYYSMSSWLENFAYAIELNAWYFILGIGITTIISVLTMSFQVRKVMSVKPARILRAE